MLRKPDPGKRAVPGREPSNGGRLLSEIEALGRALSLTGRPAVPPKARRRWKSKALKTDPLSPSKPAQKEKKPSSSSTTATLSSIWSWKPLRALSRIRHRRFDCLFTLHAHSIEGLPPSFHGDSLCVHWKRNEAEIGLRTRPARVSMGVAEFEETLEHRCAVYGSRGGGPHRAAKYEGRQFVVYPLVVGAPSVDLGKYVVDFTRLLPLTLEELEGEASGSWNTTFKLSGKARGAELNASFGFSLLGGKDMVEPGGSRTASELLLAEAVGTVEGAGKLRGLQRMGSIPASSHESKGRWRLRSRSMEDIEVVHELLLPTSGSEPVGLFDVRKLPVNRSCYQCGTDNHADGSKAAFKDLRQQDGLPISRSKALSQQVMVDLEFDDDAEFTVIEQGIEVVKKENIDDRDDLGDYVEPRNVGNRDKHELEDNAIEDNVVTAETVVEELESAFQGLSILEPLGLESVKAEIQVPEQLDYKEFKSNCKKGKANRSLSLDDVTESVASEFLSMLGIEHILLGSSSDSDPESPRERLWKQFKRESLFNKGSIFGVDIEKEEELGWKHCREGMDLCSVVHSSETEHQNAFDSTKSRTRARMLEDAETEALMREWGLNEKAFEDSPPGSASGFGSPIELPHGDPLHHLTLGDGVGPFVQTRDGGFLRSEMGSSIIEIQRHLASGGIEKLSEQASKVMPLEEITGKTMQQIAWETLPALEACERQPFFKHFKAEGELGVGKSDASKGKIGEISNPSASNYVSLEDLLPLAMEKIEALSIEGLRIQSGMSYEDAPSSISLESVTEASALEGKGAKGCRPSGPKSATRLQLLDVKDGSEDVDGLLGLSITLDEWMKLDAGLIDEDDQISSRTSRILAAHHASAELLVTGGWEGERKGSKNPGRKWGLLGNSFTIALMVQLRDPLRNYEPVGTPMFALIQAERLFIPPKPGLIYGPASNKLGSERDESPRIEHESSKEEENRGEEVVAQFRITDMHVAGLKTSPGKKKFWGTAIQEQSGYRWLLASGMGMNDKHPFMKSKAILRSLQGDNEKLQASDMFWSISSCVSGTEAKWALLCPHIRNPNIILPSELSIYLV
ncbi:hypothetical protein Taro_025316 [Colocasia esculenta]|uniref:C2 NT-type domain-containing protein n=1 Tax=Colocasia esculenta TaxID=4460 RepID=A0A843VG77_COLES|nr:hypothetical protein [Colocasia esculenta]